jgi:CcmD family protein
MESAFGPGTDPLPYIAAAYGVSVLLIAGYTLTVFRARAKIRRLISAMSEDRKNLNT